MANVQNLKRDAGPGRPKGCKNKVPATFKASIKKVFEDIATEDPELIKNAVLKGLRGKPRESFPYVQIAAHYIDGKPADVVKLGTDEEGPLVVVVKDDDE
jgi:hypothetical protein